MLSFIRKKTKGTVAWIIIVLIIIPFAFFGIQQYFTGESNIVIAKIGDSEISKNVFLQNYEKEKRKLQERIGDNYNDKIDKLVKSNSLNALITQNLQKNQAKKLSFVATNKELENRIIKQEVFFDDDKKFSFEKYKQILTLNGFSIKSFEKEEKERLVNSQFRSMLAESSFVSELTLQKLLNIKNQQRNFDYITIDANDFLDKVKVDEYDIKNVYEQQKEKFFEPAKIKINYVELSVNSLAKKVKFNEQDLVDFYEQNKNNYLFEEERKAAHILLKDKKTAQKVLDKLNKGQSFKNLAKEYSIDDDSSQKGGELEFFTKGIMVKKFDEVLFSLKPKEISKIVETEFGFHIIKLLDIKPERIKKFTEVKNEVKEAFQKQEALKEFNLLSEELANISYEYPDSLKETAKSLNLEIHTTDWFDTKGSTDSLLSNPKIIKASFSDLVLNKKENSKVIEVSNDKLIVLRMKDYQQKRQKTFTEMKGEIKKEIAIKLAIQFIQDLGEKIKTTTNRKDFNNLLSDNNLHVKKSGFIGRLNEDLKPEIVNFAFSVSKIKNKKYKGSMISEEIYGLVKIKDVKKGKWDEEEFKSFKTSVLNAENSAIYLNTLRLIKENTDIKVFSNRL